MFAFLKFPCGVAALLQEEESKNKNQAINQDHYEQQSEKLSHKLIRITMSSSARSSRISALSDKIQGLKFMQRASAASSSPSTSSISTSEEPNNTNKQTSNNDRLKTKGSTIQKVKQVLPSKGQSGTEENDEHWSLPSNISPIRKKSSVSRIEAQDGWNDWLNQFQNGKSAKTDENQSLTPIARKSFGSWAKDSKRKAKEAEEEEEEIGELDYEDNTNEGKGFIKPGTSSNSSSQSTTNKQKNKKRKSEEQDEILLDIRKDKKKKKEKKENGDKHAHSRQESASRKRKDMASDGKASRRKKEGFVVPDLNRDGDSEEFDSSDIEATLGGFQE